MSDLKSVGFKCEKLKMGFAVEIVACFAVIGRERVEDWTFLVFGILGGVKIVSTMKGQ